MDPLRKTRIIYTLAFSQAGGIFAAIAVAMVFFLPRFPWIIPAVLLLYIDLTLLIMASYYLKGRPQRTKTSKGRLLGVMQFMLLPYIAMVLPINLIQRKVWKPFLPNKIAKNIYMGPRPQVEDLPKGCGMVVDMTYEVWEVPEVVKGREYVLVPTLDQYVPEELEFLLAVERAANFKGKVYIHCMSGQGRSSIFTAALLIRKGLAKDIDEAMAIMKKKRPIVNPTSTQLFYLSRLLPQLKQQ